MSNEKGCIYCRYSDKDRKEGEKIRCKRLSKWVEPRGEACSEYFERYEFPLRVPLSELLRVEDIVMARKGKEPEA